MSRRLGLWVAVICGPALWGCGQDRAIAPEQSRVIESTDPDEVFAAATTIMRREFGRVHANQAARTIVTEPAEYTTTRDSGTARDVYHGRSTMRRTGRLTVGRLGGNTIARLTIDVERQDTARVGSAQPPSGRLNDTPGYTTPIDRDAATTDRQNAVWQYVRRDRTLERQLLDELGEQFAPRPTSRAGGATATAPAESPAGGSP